MGMVSTSFCIFLIVQSTYASPGNLSESAGGSACLAVILTLFSFMSVLVICKRIFLKKRKAARTSECFSAMDSYARSSTSGLPSTGTSGIVSYLNKGKTGFLVGFFGSPTWETRVKNLIDESRWKEYKQSSFMYKLHADSRYTKSSQTPSSVLTEKRSLLAHGTSHSLSVSTVGDIRALYEIRDATGLSQQRRSRSLRLPSRPSIAYIGSLSNTTPRRFSLPSLSRKRTSSLKSSRTVRSDFSTSFLENSSLRLVEPTKGPDYPLPLSPKHPDFQTSVNTANCATPPIPPLPSLKAGSKGLVKHENSFRISHPYALTASTNNAGVSSMMSNTRPDPLWNCLPPGSATDTADQNPVNSRQPLAPVISSLNLSPLLVTYPAAAYSPKCTLASHGTLKPTILPKIKHKGRTTSVRIRRSPAIGPSPLRAMILPENSESTLSMRSKNSFTNTAYSSLGLGLPSSTPEIHEGDDALINLQAPDTSARQTRMSGRHNSTVNESEDPNVLLGIIRELVEETRDWDGSLFKDKNFKSMVQTSRLPSFKEGQAKIETQGSGQASEDSFTKDESAEFDLSLLGVDIFRSDGETFIPANNEDRTFSQHNSVNGDGLISFWEEGGWAERDDKRNFVGVAC